MTRPSIERYMPDERRPSACGCAEEEHDSTYAKSVDDMRGAPVRVYGGSGGGYSTMTVIIVSLVGIVIGYLCKQFNIPMRFFSKSGGEMPQ
jgi:hypothetical protein